MNRMSWSLRAAAVAMPRFDTDLVAFAARRATLRVLGDPQGDGEAWPVVSEDALVRRDGLVWMVGVAGDLSCIATWGAGGGAVCPALQT